jgi:poly(A) polymerase
VTTFRKEADYVDGRHPTRVSFTDARHDVERRDFTVNALFLNPFTEEVIDYLNGREDLERKLIRTVGPPQSRFQEDKLRLLRALRFACQLDFEIERQTYQQVKEHASQLTEVSWERIRDEVLKILTGPDPSRGLKLMSDSGILEVILPEIAAMQGVQQPPQFHPEGDVFVHTCLMFELSQERSETLALEILLHDVGKPPTFTVKERIRFDGHADLGAKMAEEICRRLRISNQQIEEVVDVVKDHLRFIHVQEMRESTLKRFLRKSNFSDHLELHRLDSLASHGKLSSYHFCQEKLEELSQEAMRPKPLINGHDLIGLGLEPGPLFSEIMSAIEDFQLEGKLSSKEETLDWVRKHYL